MSLKPNSDPTVQHYNQTAEEFASSTLGVDMAHLYAEFLPHVQKGGKILDAGCGSGRDALFFKKMGFAVVAFDASAELATIAGQTLGQPVKVMSFQDFNSSGEFDGIWACASLLHVSEREIDAVLNNLSRGLKPRGVIYASFKHGSKEEFRGGRLFNDYNETKLTALLKRHPELKPVKIWQSSDARPGRSDERWQNVLLARQ